LSDEEIRNPQNGQIRVGCQHLFYYSITIKSFINDQF